jgi:hypothetical protein
MIEDQIKHAVVSRLGTGCLIKADFDLTPYFNPILHLPVVFVFIQETRA